jgi:hypothetical protein
MRFRQFLENKIYNEIDWKNDFPDVKPTCTDAKKIVDYLNAVRSQAEVEYGKREKFNITMPFFHSKSSFFKDTEKGIDIDYFIEQITKPPNNIVNTNEKILKSGGPNEFVYKTGIPAFRGIAYDIERKKFIFVNTCPGAGECRVVCYALKNRYIQYPNAYDSLTRRLNYLLNYPDKYENQLYKELKDKCEEHEAIEGYKQKVILRWNDAGDFFSKRYIRIAANVISKLKNEGYNIDSYAYTKIADVAKSNDLDHVTFSMGSKRQESEKIDPKTQKISKIIPPELSYRLNPMKIDDEKKLKQNVTNYFKLNSEDVLTYDELRLTPIQNYLRWHVIVTPNDGDDAAFRKDVKSILLVQH